MALIILASGVVGYLIGVSSTQGTNTTIVPPPTRPYEQAILAASCFPDGNTGAIIATNLGTIPVNITEIRTIDSAGYHIAATFQHGILIQSGHYATISHGIVYSGSNVTIAALSMKGTEFSTMCPASRT
jgi:hypothetical protein